MKTERRPFLTLASVVCALALTSTAMSAVAADYKMKIGIIAQNDPLHAYIKRFKERIEAETQGRIEAQLYPGAQLGGESTLVEGVQLGTIEMVVVPAVYLKGLDERFQVADAPGLFDGLEHAYGALQSQPFRDKFLAIGDERGVHGVSLWPYDMTSFATLEPLKTLGGLQGLRIRVLASDIETGLISELGAAPVPMPFTEVVPSLQRKTIDGVRTSPIIMTAFKVPTVAPHLTITNGAPIAIGAYISGRFYNQLPEDLQQAVDRVGREVEQEMLKIVRDTRSTVFSRWKQLGGEVSELPKKERAELIRISRESGEKVLATNPKTAELYDLLKQAAEAAK